VIGQKVCVGLLFVLVCVTSCKNSQTLYFQEIERLGVIPFKNPVSHLATGTVLRGSPDNVIAIAPPQRCFPNELNSRSTHLRWVSDVAIPPRYQKIHLDLNADFSSLMAVGTPGIKLNGSWNQAQRVELEIQEAQMEMMDQLSLKEFYEEGMSPSCKEILMAYPFIIEALRVTKMSFTFFDSSGGKINLTTANIADFAFLGGGLQWHIEKESKLTIETPHYIGYKLAQLQEGDEGFVNLVATQTKRGQYVWKKGVSETNKPFLRPFLFQPDTL